MRGDCLVEVFGGDYRFLDKALVKEQKHEFDYVAIGNNSLTIPGFLKAEKRNYIQITYEREKIQGIVVSVEHKTAETSIKYRPLLSLFDVEVYKERTELAGMTAERFLGSMIEENFVENQDPLQNICGLSVEYISETADAALNLVDNIHNIYELALKAFRKYGIVIDMRLDIMNQALICRIGKKEWGSRTIEGDLGNILDANIVLKEDEESVNKVIVIGEYEEEDPLYGQTLTRIFYLDKKTGETTQEPGERVEPVVFRYRTITINQETFEEDAFEEAYDLIYQEEYDNSIKIKIRREDSLYKKEEFHIGQKCAIMKSGKRYATIYTGYKSEISTVTLLFGMARVEYTKNKRRKN